MSTAFCITLVFFVIVANINGLASFFFSLCLRAKQCSAQCDWSLFLLSMRFIFSFLLLFTVFFFSSLCSVDAIFIYIFTRILTYTCTLSHSEWVRVCKSWRWMCFGFISWKVRHCLNCYRTPKNKITNRNVSKPKKRRESKHWLPLSSEHTIYQETKSP